MKKAMKKQHLHSKLEQNKTGKTKQNEKNKQTNSSAGLSSNNGGRPFDYTWELTRAKETLLTPSEYGAIDSWLADHSDPFLSIPSILLPADQMYIFQVCFCFCLVFPPLPILNFVLFV